MKIVLRLAAVLLIVAPALASPPASSSDFTLSAPSRIPGATLQPGTYSIHIVNKLSDRVILRIDGKGGTIESTFIGINKNHFGRPSSAGPVRWASSPAGPGYLKGWYFPGSPSVVEFVYPKAEALAIASSNPSKVLAVDPASEGKVADNTLSAEDMQLLTLWQLSVQPVGTGDQAPAVKAERYQTASLTTRKPVVAALPHTASLVPLIWLAGLCSILIAASLRVFQWRRPDSLLRSFHAGRTDVDPYRL